MAHDELILDRYEPIGTAGAGGFGTVEIAWDPRIQRKVAIKTIKLTALDAARAALPGAQAVSNPSTAERWHGAQPWNEFLAESEPSEATDPQAWDNRADELDDAGEGDAGAAARDQITSLAHLPGLDEARTAAMLSDPRIVTVYDFEVRGRMAYLIMEYVEGITLTSLLSDYPDFITLDMIAAVFDSVAGALDAAHGAGVLHLDIKPDNILINAQGQVKVTDFGLATLADASGAGTTGGGTIGYMPLEQMRREHLDARTDEWSLASVTYEMLTGSNPFRARNLDEAERAIENAELILPSLCWENADGQIDDVMFYALDPDKDERYESVADFAEELDKFLGDAEEGAEQLALVVEDALGLEDEAGEETDEQWDDRWENVDGKTADARPGFLGNLLSLLPSATSRRTRLADGGVDDEISDARYGVAPDEYESGINRDDLKPGWRSREARGAREPIATRIPPRAIELGSRILAALASGFTAFFALSNMQILTAGFGSASQYVIVAIAAAVAIFGALWPHIGAFAAFGLLGIAIILCGQPIVGAVLLIATVVWWYAVGHLGKAAANTALLVPVLGAIGGSSAIPLLAGAALKPAHAIATTAFALVCAFALGTLGSASLLGWNAFDHWMFSRADAGEFALTMIVNPATWATAAGWIASSASLALLRSRESRLLTILGLAVAVAAVLVGSLVFSAPTPQLIVPVCLATAILLAKR